MRSAELVGVAQTIAGCGEIGGVGRRREIAQSRMRPALVVIVDPVRDLGPGMIEAEEQALVEKLVAHAPLKLSQKPFCIGFPGAMKCQTSLLSCAQANRAFEVNSVPLSETIMPGLPGRSINAVSSRATRRPEIEVSGIAARHCRVTSSTMLRIRNRRPKANWSWTKSRDQRALAAPSTTIGARVPTARRRDRRLRTVRPSSR